MKHLFFDLDGTITESRQKITKEIKDFLSQLPNLIVISGASREQMEYQLDGLKCITLAQSGNDTPLWQNKLSKEEKHEIYKHIFSLDWCIEPFMIEDRGCQLSPSLIGHKAPTNIKKKFDPDQKIRRKLLKKCPFISRTLICRIAGTTCLDYTRKNGDKGHNLERWIKENKLNKEDCVYFGDALFQGGNDESVLGVMECVEVKDPQDLLVKIKNYV